MHRNLEYYHLECPLQSSDSRKNCLMLAGVLLFKLLRVTYVVAVKLLLLIKLRVQLVDTWAVVGWITTEGNIKVLQELVAATEEGLWSAGVRVNTWLTVENNDTVSQVGGHDEIVLNDEGSLLGVHDESLDDTGSDNALLRVEVSRWLIDQVDISWDTKGENDGNTLQFSSRQVLDLLVDEVVQLQWLDNISLELWRQELLLDLLEKELANTSLELWSDGLWLHGNLHLWNPSSSIWLNGTSKHLTESGLSSSVLSHHNNDLGISEITLLNAKVEVAQGLLHRWVAERARSVGHKLVGGLCNTESQRLLTETQVLSRDVTVQEDVDSLTNGCWHSNHTIDSWATVENADEIGEVIQDGQIVLDNDDIVVWTEKRSDDGGSLETLLDIKVGRRLVEHVDIGLLDTDSSDSETLKLSTGKECDIAVHNVVELKNVTNLLEVIHLGSALDQGLDTLVCCANGLWNLVDILRFDNSLQIVLKELCEVVYGLVSWILLRSIQDTYSGAQSHGSA